MKFDTIIIGGGLTALTAGIRLQQAKQRVAVIGAGQSTLHFNTGTFDLLGFDAGGKAVDNPLEAIKALPATHPYHKINNVAARADEARDLLKAANILAGGENTYNHCRLTPMGELMPTWLSVNGMLRVDGQQLPYKDIVLANIEGFLDFHTAFLKPALEKLGAKVSVCTFTTPELEAARRSPSEFRATTIGNYLSQEQAARNLARALHNLPKADCILMPAILGLTGDMADTIVRETLNTPVYCVATMHPSRVGYRIAEQLRRHFTAMGGELFLSDTVEQGDIRDGKVVAVHTHNMADEPLTADNYLLATGSFMSRGLSSNYQEVWEPVFHVDVEASAKRADWHNAQFFSSQAFLSYGVKADDRLHALKGGQSVANLYAAGSILAGNDFIHYADHEGVDLLTALEAADNILRG